MNHEHPESVPVGSIQGPGAQLAQARADLRLTHEEVAAKLHLATRQIQALEQDDYRSLPGPTYVRGYLKSYALLLGLTPAPILDAHARLTAVPVAASDFKTIAPQKEITSRHHQVRFVTYIVALLVIGLAVAWWQARDTRPPHPMLTAPQDQPAAAGADAAPVADAPFVAGKADESPLTDSTAVPAPTTGKLEPLPSTPAQAPAPPAPAAPAAPAAAAPTPPAPILTGPRVQLILKTEQESWADIRDARQVRLLYETVAAGRTVTLEAVAPVTVYLGNAAGVHLEYNGKPVDVARHQRGVTARLTLGESEAAAPAAR